MTVLRIIARLNVGGPARHVTILDHGLQGLGFTTLLAHGEIGAGEASLEHLLVTAGVPARRIPGLGRRVSPFSDLRALASLVSLVFRLRPDVVHTHTAKAGALGRLAAGLYNASRSRQKRCLIVHTFHGHVLHGYFGRLASLVVRAIERCLGRLTDCVLVLSPLQRRDIGDRYRIAGPSRIHIVPLGLELSALTTLPVAAGAATGTVVFGYVGRFVEIKNLPLLIEAFAAVSRQAPGARLMLIGDGELRGDLEALVARHGLQRIVELAGWREDLEDVYRMIDVLVLASRNEGTPVAVIEAMAAALPVIATDVGGVPDVVTDGVTGLLVPSESVERLAAAMLRLAGSPDERRRLGTAARDDVRTRFSAARLVSDVAELYRTALDAKRLGRSSADTAKPRQDRC